MTTLQYLIDWATEDLQDGIDAGDAANEDEVYDLIYEIVDSRMPIYHVDVLAIAQSNLWLAVDVPEVWPAYWIASPVNLILSNIYEYVKDELFDWYYKNKIE